MSTRIRSKVIVIPKAVMTDQNLSPKAILLYGVLLDTSEKETMDEWPWTRTCDEGLAERSGNSERNVQRLLKQLEDNHWILRETQWTQLGSERVILLFGEV